MVCIPQCFDALSSSTDLINLCKRKDFLKKFVSLHKQNSADENRITIKPIITYNGGCVKIWAHLVLFSIGPLRNNKRVTRLKTDIYSVILDYWNNVFQLIFLCAMFVEKRVQLKQNVTFKFSERQQFVDTDLNRYLVLVACMLQQWILRFLLRLQVPVIDNLILYSIIPCWLFETNLYQAVFRTVILRQSVHSYRHNTHIFLTSLTKKHYLHARSDIDER